MLGSPNASFDALSAITVDVCGLALWRGVNHSDVIFYGMCAVPTVWNRATSGRSLLVANEV